MIEKPIKAHMFDYAARFLIPGTKYGDAETEAPMKAFYVPNADARDALFVISVGPRDVRSTNDAENYRAFVGKDADHEHDGLVKELEGSGITPRDVDLPPCFLEWAVALHAARNPPRAVHQFIKLY